VRRPGRRDVRLGTRPLRMRSTRLRTTGRTRPTPDESGFTLLELTIAMVIMSIAVAGLVGVLGTAFKSTAIDIHRTDATAIAAQGLAELESAPLSGPLPSVTRNAQTFTVTGTVGRATASNGDGNAYTALAVTVVWSDQGGLHTVTQSTARFPGATTSTSVPCPSFASVPVTVTAPATGGASVDVSWAEPAGGGVSSWQVQLRPQGSAPFTTAAVEAPLAPGAGHWVEVGGLAPTTKYFAQLYAVTRCGDLGPFGGGPTAKTSGAADATCVPGSVTLDSPVATRSSVGGALTADVTVTVTAPAPCVLWAAAQATDGTVITTPLTADSKDTSFSGVLGGTTSTWDLGVHQVLVLLSSPDPLAPWPPSGAVGTAVLCVQQQSSPSC
jgi:prepilin-type N-terminal cleavage/methylation domain-containing protein